MAAESRLYIKLTHYPNLGFRPWTAGGRRTQAVQVTAASPSLKTDTSDVGQVIGSTKVTELSLHERDFLPFATLTSDPSPSTMMIR